MRKLKEGEEVIVLMDVDKPMRTTKFKKLLDSMTALCEDGTYYLAALWPAECCEELEKLLSERKRLKKALDEQLSKFYNLKNRC